MITTVDLTKQYGPNTVVDGVNLAVSEGSRYGLLGPNGSGKTTLIRMLLGLVFATRGEIAVMGAAVPRHVGRVLPRVGALVEGPAAYGHLSGRRNLELLDAAGPGGRRRNRAQRVGDALDRVGLGGVDRRPVKAYSLGMRQRLGLAGALLRQPDLLILDEPTNGLDPLGNPRDPRSAHRPQCGRYHRAALQSPAGRGRAALYPRRCDGPGAAGASVRRRPSCAPRPVGSWLPRRTPTGSRRCWTGGWRHGRATG